MKTLLLLVTLSGCAGSLSEPERAECHAAQEAIHDRQMDQACPLSEPFDDCTARTAIETSYIRALQECDK